MERGDEKRGIYQAVTQTYISICMEFTKRGQLILQDRRNLQLADSMDKKMAWQIDHTNVCILLSRGASPKLVALIGDLNIHEQHLAVIHDEVDFAPSVCCF